MISGSESSASQTGYPTGSNQSNTVFVLHSAFSFYRCFLAYSSLQCVYGNSKSFFFAVFPFLFLFLFSGLDFLFFNIIFSSFSRSLIRSLTGFFFFFFVSSFFSFVSFLYLLFFFFFFFRSLSALILYSHQCARFPVDTKFARIR